MGADLRGSSCRSCCIARAFNQPWLRFELEFSTVNSASQLVSLQHGTVDC